MSFHILSRNRSIYRHLQFVTVSCHILDNCPARVVNIISRLNECLTLAKLSVKTFVDGLFFWCYLYHLVIMFPWDWGTEIEKWKPIDGNCGYSKDNTMINIGLKSLSTLIRVKFLENCQIYAWTLLRYMLITFLWSCWVHNLIRKKNENKRPTVNTRLFNFQILFY